MLRRVLVPLRRALAVLEATLMTLVKNGDVAKVNGKWVISA